MKHNNYTHTTTEHATIIARTALRTCAAKAGRAEKIDNMRAALGGRDAAVMRMYGRAMDDTDAYDALRVQPLTDAADLVQVDAPCYYRDVRALHSGRDSRRCGLYSARCRAQSRL